MLIGNIINMLLEVEVYFIFRNFCNFVKSYGEMIFNILFCVGDEDGIFDICRVRLNNFFEKYFLKLEGVLNKVFGYFLVKI